MSVAFGLSKKELMKLTSLNKAAVDTSHVQNVARMRINEPLETINHSVDANGHPPSTSTAVASKEGEKKNILPPSLEIVDIDPVTDESDKQYDEILTRSNTGCIHSSSTQHHQQADKNRDMGCADSDVRRTTIPVHSTPPVSPEPGLLPLNLLAPSPRKPSAASRVPTTTIAIKTVTTNPQTRLSGGRNRRKNHN
ncbi:hypothetical protein BLNAU_23417 [Blattamonas nauphoetae]|uniref:Uncharacterized protein n=1 Tax=Blattamonas nauphoetae TaxID=2049346 RepID=A0ABQ9WQB3_9EUKA|nr:hypothetical protein BLNAU_23417 [Blattamonas nauphoetae]